MLNDSSKAVSHWHASRNAPNLKLACVLSAAVAVIGINLALAARSEHLTRVFFLEQDVAIAVLALVLLLAAFAWPRKWRGPIDALPIEMPVIRMRTMILAVLGLIAFGTIGHTAIMHGLAFSRDEQMALFDARVFATGHLVGAIPADWQSLLDVMNTKFLIIPPGETRWVSSYLPVNAMLHAPAIKAGLGALVNPTLAAVGLYATWDVARQIWPDDRNNAIVAGLLYLTSTQVWAMSMTPFAMTGHLALNMVWLLCFLRGGRGGHIAAVLTGFAATGLHQVVFHPLFVLPFCILLLVRRNWPLATFYAVSYLLIGLFWISYAKWTIYAGVPSEVHAMGGLAGYVERARALIEDYPPHRLALMAANLLRFFAWQNLILLPLLLVALWTLRWRKDGLLIAMFCALALTPIAMFLLLAYQGHGWGYRYMHGLIGIACILGTAGWHHLQAHVRQRQRALVIATTATVFVCAPYLLWHTRDLVSAFAEADRIIRGQNVDIVVIDDTLTGLAPDLITPQPFNDGTPVRLMASKVDRTRLAALCRRYTVARVTNVGRDRTPSVAVACR